MKLNTWFMSLLAIGITIGLSLTCCSESNETPEEDTLLKLAHPWKLESAELGNSVMDGYEHLELTFSGSTGTSAFAFSLVGRPETSPWPEDGLCTFSAGDKSMIIRDPGTAEELQMHYSFHGEQLIITFNYSGAGYAGRVSSVEGNWTFVFSRK